MKKLLGLIIAVVVVSSCTKEKEVTYISDVILNGSAETKWVLWDLQNNGREWKSRYLDSCAIDDILVFKNDDTYQVEDGTAVCDTLKGSNIVREGLWEVSEHQDTIYFLPTDNSPVVRARVVDVENTRIIYTVIDGAGDLIQYTYYLQ